MSVPNSLMFPKIQRFKSQNGLIFDEKAELFYVNILKNLENCGHTVYVPSWNKRNCSTHVCKDALFNFYF